MTVPLGMPTPEMAVPTGMLAPGATVNTKLFDPEVVVAFNVCAPTTVSTPMPVATAGPLLPLDPPSFVKLRLLMLLLKPLRLSSAPPLIVTAEVVAIWLFC